MKRKTLNFVMLCIITLSFASGCTKNVDNGLTIDGKEVIVKVGDEYFTADQLFGEMSVSTTNIKTFYEEVKKLLLKKILRLILLCVIVLMLKSNHGKLK